MSFPAQKFHDDVDSHFIDNAAIFTMLKSILLGSKVPSEISDKILSSLISRESNNRHLIALKLIVQDYAKIITEKMIESISSMFMKTTTDTININDELLLIQSKVVKFKGFRNTLYNGFIESIKKLNIPNYSDIEYKILTYEIDNFVFNLVLNVYETGKGIHADNIFVESSWDEYLEFIKSDARLISADFQYFFAGYTIYHRLLKAMMNKYLRIPLEMHVYVYRFLSHGFLNKLEKESALEDDTLPLNFIKIREKFDGLAYATPDMFEFYEFCAMNFYNIMSLSNVIIYHRDNPPNRIKEMLLASTITKEKFNKLFNDAMIPLMDNMQIEIDNIQMEKTRKFMFVFIISGMVNLQNKSIFSRVLPNFIKPDVNIGGVRVAVTISSAKAKKNIRVITPDKNTDIETNNQTVLSRVTNAMAIVTPDKENDNDNDDDDDDDDDEEEDIDEALKMINDIESSTKKLSISTGEYTHSSVGTSINSNDSVNANLSPQISPS